jgi:hypothetical protein
MKTREAGWVVVYILVTLAILTCVIATLMALNAEKRWNSAGSVAAAAALVSLVGLGLELRRDSRAAAMYGAAMLAAAAMFSGVTWWVTVPHSLIALAVAASTAAGAAASLFYLRKAQSAPDNPLFPNVLRSHVRPEAIFETSGIQVTGQSSRAGGGGETMKLVLLLQNCWGAARQVTFHLDDGMPLSPAAIRARFPSSYAVRLGPAEVGAVTIHVLSPESGGAFTLSLGISVSGSGGRRVRPWQARELSARINAKTTALLLPLGLLAWGGGLKLQFGPSAPGPRAGTPLPPEWHVQWTPAPGSLPGTASLL